ncbi:RNA-directed DNA polymerase (reverse transcriptase)-related family protein, partial [Striga hermonthica]
LKGHFKGGRSLRQGDPLSPFLFMICMEYLSRLIKRKTTLDTNFKYHPMCEKLKISYLAFADDLMLLSRGDPHSIQVLMDCLKDFGAKSGLEMNVVKSNIYLAGVKDDSQATILDNTNLRCGSMPFRYLGVPLTADRITARLFDDMIKQIEGQLSRWNGHTLSYAGRLKLLRSVVQGIVCFWMGIFHLPDIVRTKITQLCRRFLWGSKSAHVAWDSVCLPRLEGGLGLRDLIAWNQALLTRMLWNMQAKKDTLWQKWIHNIYLKGNSIWEWEVRPNDSPLFKSLIDIRQTLVERAGSERGAEALLRGWNSHDRQDGSSK